MRTIPRVLKGRKFTAFVAAASMALATFVAATPADAQWGWRGGVGWRGGLGGYGWRGGLGWRGGYGWRGYGYGAAALAGAAIGYGLASPYYGYGYGYGYPRYYDYYPTATYYDYSPGYYSGGCSCGY